MAWCRKTGSWPDAGDRALVTDEIVEDHDNMLAYAWDNTVGKDDIVYVLGDLTASSKNVPAGIEWIKSRRGIKHFIAGNHDPVHPMHQDSHKWEDTYREAFASVGVMRKRKIGGKLVMLSHFPYTGDGSREGDRDQQFRLRDMGLPVIHGHVHTKERKTFALGGNASPQIHIGVDAWNFRPVSLDQVVELLA